MAIRVFVSGDRAQVGKSTVCLGLVGALLESGYKSEDIAYIKPATQCEKPQLIAKFCAAKGIACVPIGPVVFYKGFTRDFLKGETESSEELLTQIRNKVEELSREKKIVIIDGVGYPAVGSICGVSNADVAKTLHAPVLLVGKKGVGDAVDSFNLNAAFFASHGVPVLGAVFNRLPLDGFYSLDQCKEFIELYFSTNRPDQKLYGFLPEVETNDTIAVSACGDINPSDQITSEEIQKAEVIIQTFTQHVDLAHLVSDATSVVESVP